MKHNIMTAVQNMYDESGEYWHTTRSKKYRMSGTNNWSVVQKYLDGLHAHDTVLDVGCGDGRLLTGLSNSILYTGLDFSKSLLHQARSHYPHADFRYGNIVESPTWEHLGQYTALFCVAVLHHIPEKEQQVFILREMKEHTLNGGFLFLTVWNLAQEKFIPAHLASTDLKNINPRWVEIPFAHSWKRFCVQMDIPYLVEIFSLAGWSIDDIFFADRDGNKADIRTGYNIVVVAR